MNHPDPGQLRRVARRRRDPADACAPIVELIGRDAVPFILDCAAAFERWADETSMRDGFLPRIVGMHPTRLRGVAFERITTPYTMWMVQRVTDVYRAPVGGRACGRRCGARRHRRRGAAGVRAALARAAESVPAGAGAVRDRRRRRCADGAARARLASERGRAAARDVRDVPRDRVRHRRRTRLALRARRRDDPCRARATTRRPSWCSTRPPGATSRPSARRRPGLVYGGRVRFARGGQADLERWEPALRALFDGRPIFDPASTTSATRSTAHGGRRSPTADEALRGFLHATGYLHVRGVFARDEIARLADVVADRQARRASGGRPLVVGDDVARERRSSAGSSISASTCPLIAALSDDARLRRLAVARERAAASRGRSLRRPLGRHQERRRRRGSLRPPVASRLRARRPSADVPDAQHRHPARRGDGRDGPALASSPARGAPRATGATSPARATVAIDTEPGDVTVHFGDVDARRAAADRHGPGPPRALHDVDAGAGVRRDPRGTELQRRHHPPRRRVIWRLPHEQRFRRRHAHLVPELRRPGRAGALHPQAAGAAGGVRGTGVVSWCTASRRPIVI